MALRHALAAACLVLTFAALPSSAASGDVVRSATYAVGTSAHDDLGPVDAVVVTCVEAATDTRPTSVGTFACQFVDVGAGTYVVRVRDQAFGALAFSYVGVVYEDDVGLATFCSPEVDGVVDATITLTADCPGIKVTIDALAATVGTITIEVA